MSLFAKRTTLKDIVVKNMITWSDHILGTKDELTASAQKEGSYVLTQKQLHTLWTNLEYFYLIELYLFANKHAQGAVNPEEIGAVISEVYLSYLVHQKKMSTNDALAKIEECYGKFSELVLEDATASAQRRADLDEKSLNYSDIINIASESFCTKYAYYDSSTQKSIESNPGDAYSDGMFDSERVAFKLVRATVSLISESFQNSKIVW